MMQNTLRALLLMAALHGTVAFVKPSMMLEGYPFWPGLPCGTNDPGLPRILVSSHHSYGPALDQLLYSMIAIGFSEFCRVTVVFADATQNVPPERKGNLTIVHSIWNAYDFTVVPAAREHANNSLIGAPVFIMLHDTTTVQPHFIEFFYKLPAWFTQNSGVVLRTVSGNSNNIGSFIPSLFDMVGTFYNKKFTKTEAVALEDSLRGLVEKGGGKVFHEPEGRVWMETIDLYHTGYPRTIFHFPAYGIFKYVFYSFHGDFDGQKISN